MDQRQRGFQGKKHLAGRRARDTTNTPNAPLPTSELMALVVDCESRQFKGGQ
jgi:hypothetical protein